LSKKNRPNVKIICGTEFVTTRNSVVSIEKAGFFGKKFPVGYNQKLKSRL
jgi:hypothetical protein